MTLNEVRRVKARFASSLLARRGVVACGVGYKEIGGDRTDELCVVVSVVEKVSRGELAPSDFVPPVLGGVRTDVQETGIIRALWDRTTKWRPAPGGVSIGHIDITAGTLGCLVTKDDLVYILSNNHVLANSNQAQIGDPILQPGPHDGGTIEDRIATLEEFVPIVFETGESVCPIANRLVNILNPVARLVGSRHRLRAFQQDPEMNLVDAAIARPISADLVSKRILEIGEPQGINEGVLGLKVRKSGRTTGLTSDEITQVYVTVQVSYGAGKVAVFTDQLLTGAMCAGGDSGSVVVDGANHVIGLLFAGSKSATIINRIQNVVEALGVDVHTYCW